ncbi:hypothetical protein VNO78_11945 [Psophocarpus tetragonolobus]|uniref:Remorin C-terminal domain-containing protein n=1 Tax=Psophocarpus tetragonolobus TaxID=3891 RepID=A0AAN9SM86_PSOTE
MEALIKQLRVKLTGAEEENKADLGGSRDQKVTTQKTVSFKDKKKAPNWIQRQFSRNMSHDYDTEMEHATAVAAAAYAIYSQQFSLIPQHKKARETSLTRGKSKVDDTKPPISQFGGTSRQYSDQGNKAAPATSMRRSSTFGEKLKSDANGKKPEISAPPKKTPTFGDEHTVNTTDEIKPETPPPKVPSPVQQPMSSKLPPPPLLSLPPSPPSPTRQGAYQTKADGWEREEQEKIKERYEKLLETIDSWERKKKAKAIRKLNKHQHSESERRRMKALNKYQDKMNYINQIAGGARAQADERRRNEVLKAKEKANIIRITGKIPGPCSCF